MAILFDLAKKGVHHGDIGHGCEIKGPAAEQASKKELKWKDKLSKNMPGKTMIFLSILASFWEPFRTILGAKGLQKSREILDAILEAKICYPTHFLGSAQRNARGPGEDYGGDKNLFQEKILANLGKESILSLIHI